MASAIDCDGKICLFVDIRQHVCGWLTLVTNTACVEKPDHIRRNAVDAVRMAASSVVSLVCSRHTIDEGWNVLAFRSDFCCLQLLLTSCVSELNSLKPNSSICYICHTGLTSHFSFLTFGHLSARVPECQKLKMVS